MDAAQAFYSSTQPCSALQISGAPHYDPSSFRQGEMVRFWEAYSAPKISLEQYFQKISEQHGSRDDFSAISNLGSFVCHYSDRKILDCVRLKLAEIHSFQKVVQGENPLEQVLLAFQTYQGGGSGSMLPFEILKQGAKDASELLPNIIKELRNHCLQSFDQLSNAELWDLMLKNQVELLFDLEFQEIAKWKWWQDSNRILEIGSGNGSYLHRCACEFQGKTFRGMEMRPQYVKEAQEHYVRRNIVFQEGDAEVLDERLIGSADAVVYRLVVQYLKNPIMALQNTAQYLSSGGHLIIIDTCDSAVRTSHPIPSVDEGLRELARVQEKEQQTGNRKVTLELLHGLESGDSPLCELYEVVFSNLDKNGEVLREFVRIEGSKNALYFNQILLFSHLLKRHWHIPIDLAKAYDETVAYLTDDSAWTLMGMHLLVLKKR